MTAIDKIKGLVPRAPREQVRELLVRYGENTADQRPLPDFLIIGTKRGGTTSLWRYLIQHPLVPRLFPAWNTKTSHYFEDNFARGEAWYRSHFPTQRQRAALERKHGGPCKAGEAAPLYMFHPLAAGRVAELMPQARMIVLLRDPVERAYSHWKERRGEGVEPLSFAAALAAEESRTAGEFSTAHDWYSYRARGRYLEHLEPWLDRFDRSQLLFVPSETFYREPARTYAGILDFIGLPRHDLPAYDVFNDRPSRGMDPDVRAELTEYFRPFNAALADRLGMSFDWAS
ncbi:sulfotransferase [Actinoplanes sp. N902-109]|uniref:sulfotransferase family protein n=1 Tax=Actinoplanes sp. (strain N902-109) TaxID=649831 RepID=UPI0003295770|nr:sulfotransferase [Actinoplanes sp. N902-109]AGL19981.1 sulfotransferase [Actinoplanes sp. N902-109]